MKTKVFLGYFIGLLVFLPAVQAALIHRYSFEAGAQDLVGSAHGTLEEGAWILHGRVLCDGIDDYVWLPGSAIHVNGLDAVTLEIWLMQPRRDQSYSMAVALGDTRPNGYARDYLFISTSRGDQISRAGAALTDDPTAPWRDEYGVNGPEYYDLLDHHYVLTVENQTLAFYVDGTFQGDVEVEGLSLGNLSSNAAYLARSLNTAGPMLCCAINEFRIYNTALSAATIAQHAQAGPDALEGVALTVTSTEGGQVVTPGEGTFIVESGQTIALEAVAHTGYAFLGWTGSSVQQGGVADPCAAVTETVLDDDAAVCAVFAVRDVNVTGDMQLEVRGYRYCEDPNDPLAQPGAYPLETLPDTVDTRVVENLWISAQSQLSLVDLYHDHPSEAYDVLYVRNLGLGREAQLNLAGQRLYYLNLRGDLNQIVDQAVFAGELGTLDLTDPEAFARQVTTNNTAEANFVSVVEDANIADHPLLYLQAQGQSPARSKTYLGRFSQDRVEVGFTYLFASDDPDQLLSVYLSDRADLLDLDDSHCVLAGQFAPPEAGRPGSFQSGRLASFSLSFDVGGLDPNQGLWLELVLAQAQSTHPLRVTRAKGSSTGGTYIDRQSLCLRCPGICLDLTGDNQVTFEDYTLAVAGCGRAASDDIPATSPVPCMDQGYGRNGSVDGSDLGSISDLLSRGDLCSNLCGLGWVGSATDTTNTATALPRRMVHFLTSSGADLLLLGQGSIFRGGDEFIGQDNLMCGFDGSGHYVGDETLPFTQGNIRLVRNGQDEILVLNTLTGLCRMDGTVLLGPCQKEFQDCTVTLGLQTHGDGLAGRPLLDAAFYGDDLYVAPVVVVKEGGTHLAAARLAWGNEDFEIQALYADPNDSDVTSQNPNLTGLRGLEVDSEGRVYLLNAHQQNASDVLWLFDAQGHLLKRQFLDELGLANPIGFCYDPASDRIYLAHGLNRTGQEQGTSLVLGLSWNDQDLQVTHRITIDNLQHVTDITADGQGVLWITGLDLTETPEVLYPWETPYPVPDPRLVQVATREPGDMQVEAVSLYGLMDINLPLSILWTGD